MSRLYLMADSGNGPQTVGRKRPDQVPDEHARTAWVNRQLDGEVMPGGATKFPPYWLVEAESADAARRTIEHGAKAANGVTIDGVQVCGRILASGGAR